MDGKCRSQTIRQGRIQSGQSGEGKNKIRRRRAFEEKRSWWENEEQGYASDLELNAEYDLDEITCEKWDMN
jgi:hypothetical protein